MKPTSALLLALALAASSAIALAQVAPSTSASATSPSAARSSEPSPAASASSSSPGKVDRPASTFVSRCSGCHTVGGGKLQGPDLLPSTQWTEDQLRPAIKLMEKRVGPLANEDLDDLVALLRDPTVRDRITGAQKASMEQTESSLERPSPTVGSALFHGPRALSKGGLPCATCHQVSGEGGSLGPDLTDVASRISGPPLISAVQNASFNVMRAAYRDHPISRQEAIHIAAWFESLKGTQPVASATQFPFFGFALGALAFLAIVVSLRPRSGVRASLLRRAMRK